MSCSGDVHFRCCNRLNSSQEKVGLYLSSLCYCVGEQLLWWGSRNLGDFNFSVHWTEDWKTANITPIYKSYEIKMAENYCPVSLTSIIVKALENLVHIHIVRFLRDHSLLSGNQHCFRWLLQLLHDWLRFNHLDKPSSVDVVFLDCQIVCQCLILISFTNLINMELRDSHFAG